MKRSHLWTLSLLAGAALLVAPFCLSAVEEGAPPTGNSSTAPPMLEGEGSYGYVVPESLTDLPFEKYVDISLLELAWKTKDASLMTDLALQLQEGEKVLLRPHKAGSAEDLLRLATSIAAKDGNTEAIKRIADVAKAREFTKVAALTANATKLAGASRSDEPELQVQVDKVNPTDYAVYGAIVGEIRNAELLGDTRTLEGIEKEVDSFKNLSSAQREYLKRISGAARSAKPDATIQDNSIIDTISKLEGESRHDNAGQIVGQVLQGVGQIIHGGSHGGHGGHWGGGGHGGHWGGGGHGGHWGGGGHGGHWGGGGHGGHWGGGGHGGHWGGGGHGGHWGGGGHGGHWGGHGGHGHH